MATEPRDWIDWHKQYDDPESNISRRLVVVRQRLREALDAREGPLRLISMCAGQGVDVIPVLAESRRRDVEALLVELDPRLAGIAEESARAAGLDNVRVLRGDAALTANYEDAVPADIILAVGIFGNISEADIEFTVKHLLMLAAERATVIWTRGRFNDDDPMPDTIRRWFEEAGFEELSFDAPEDTRYRVGVNRLARTPDAFDPEVTLFRFFR